MRFAVLGAGAIGAYVGASLARGGAEVVLIARGAHLEAMRRNGVTVLSERGDFTVHPEVTDELDAVAGADAVVLGLKAYSLPELVPRIAPLLGDAAVIPAQNGVPWWFFQGYEGPLAGTVVEAVDPGGVLTRSVPAGAVVGCVPYPATEIAEPGVIRHLEGTRFVIGEPSGGPSERCRLISEAFVAGGLKCPVDPRLRDQVWLKLIGNVAFNPVTTLTGSTLGELALVPELRSVLRAILEEGAAVGEALGITLPVSIDRRLEAGMAVGAHKTSMRQDFEAGKPLELACMTGALIEIAGRVGIPVPHTETVHACTRLLEQLRDRGPSDGEARTASSLPRREPRA